MKAGWRENRRRVIHGHASPEAAQPLCAAHQVSRSPGTRPGARYAQLLRCAHSFKRTHYTCRYFMHVCGRHIHWRKQECTEQDCFASVCRWTLMELGRTQSVYEHDGWPSGGSFPTPPAPLERRPAVTALATEGTNNGSCEFAELGLPCLSGRSEHPSWTAHNSEGSGGVLVACGNNKGVKWEQIMKVHSSNPTCWGLFMSTDPTTEKPQVSFLIRSRAHVSVLCPLQHHPGWEAQVTSRLS